MEVFTVVKPNGATPKEFETFTRLLEEAGIDVADAPRVPEPNAHRRWLYAWKQRREAEGFARELRHRTRDGSWKIERLEIDQVAHGPVAPLDIYEMRDEDESSKYYLAPSSRERVVRAFPNSSLYPVTISPQTLHDIKQQWGESWWDELCSRATSLSKEKVLSLGGYRVIVPDGGIGHEELQAVPASS